MNSKLKNLFINSDAVKKVVEENNKISSTLYNAVLIANLEVTERHAHSKRVYYVPKNKDATIFYGGPDFRFKNTLESDIIINVKADGNNVTVSLIEVKTMDI